jgi:ligand-binding SRPBCC domain-containing protein
VPSDRELSVVQTSRLAAPADQVWSRVVSAEGINHELGPWMRMTMPKSVRGKTIDEVPVGEALGRSWVLLFGVVPVDYDDLCLAELEPGRRFLERSRLFSMARWQHEREVRPDGGGCEVSDRLTFELRRPVATVPGSAAAARAVIARVFRHRHRRLAAWFGSAA